MPDTLYDLWKCSSYWKQGDIKVFENTYGTNFEAVCTEIIECDSFKLTPRGWQKGGFFVVAFEGYKGENLKRFGLE
jgi:hypothetical protein